MGVLEYGFIVSSVLGGIVIGSFCVIGVLFLEHHEVITKQQAIKWADIAFLLGGIAHYHWLVFAYILLK